MSSSKHKHELLNRFRELGFKSGDVVYLHARLLDFGKLADTQEEFVKAFLDPLFEVIGYPQGTVVALTYTTSYSSDGKPYHHETSPSEAGLLTESIRTMPGAVRSLHPMGSVSAVGSRAHEICDAVSRSLFGWNSVYHRLHQVKAKGLYLGMSLKETCSFMHYVEQLYGVTHCYHKAYFHPVFKDGKEVPGPFLAFVRDRRSSPFDYARFEAHMRKQGMLKETSYQGAPLQVVNFEDCFNEGMALLQQDPCFFLQTPFYVTE
ncbi:aminoglycoside N(3)-acetyltransferase [Candidatus Uhrbacteria bacterium]|nr:MAG: aminoglycoside N(3)-acetyltransferase [Candidatus Uhrbacteria bacterium]